MTPEEFKIYFKHTIGISLLGIWSKNNDVSIHENIIDIPFSKSHLFKIGIPTSIREKYLYLACERNELNWLKRIVWNRLIIDKFNKKIILISQRLEGDKENIPDVTEIAIAIPYENNKKIELLENQKKIGIKEFHIEEKNILIGKDIFSLIPIVFLENKNEKYFNHHELKKYTTHNDLITGNITRTNVFKAQYKGEIVNHFSDSRLNFLIKSFDEKNFEGMYEDPSYLKSTPEDLKEFSHKNYDYEAEWIKERNLNNNTVFGKKEDLEKINEDILKRWG